MLKIKDHKEKTFWIAKSIDNSVVHAGSIKTGLVMDSGQEELETFKKEKDWVDRLNELNVDIPEY